MSEYLPTVHLAHVATIAYIPGAHAVHDEAPERETEPAPQVVQFVPPDEGLKVPASQGLQVLLPLESANVPALHGGQYVLPRRSAAVPLMHSSHALAPS